MKREFLVNPIIISVPVFSRIEYIIYENGRKVIYAVRDKDNYQRPYGTFSDGTYKPKGKIISETLQTISQKDSELYQISKQLARKHKLVLSFMPSDFRNFNLRYPYLAEAIPSLDKMRRKSDIKGEVLFYSNGYTTEVRFGPLITISFNWERAAVIHDFTDEFKRQVEELYKESNIFQTREKGSSVLRKL